jgi:cell wall-associated protease
MKNETASKLLAILDSGFDLEHEDLEESWYYWPYDVIGDTYIDSIWQPDANPSPPCNSSAIACYHGTMVLGLVSAMIDNTIGLAGIEDACDIMPIKICDLTGQFRDKSVIKAFRYASTRPHSPEVYSCSWHFGQYYPDVEHELEILYNSGHPVFFATGNYGVVEYPAYSKYAFAVGATDRYDLVPSWSGKGDSLDICAPGKDVWSFDLSGDYGINTSQTQYCNGDLDYFCYYSGTSVSAPIVAAVSTKILSTKPELIPKMSNAEPI